MIEPTRGNDQNEHVPPNTQLRKAREATPSKIVPGECMSRAELADEVNAYLWRTTKKRYELDGHTIGRYESGKVRWPGDIYRAGLRAVLGAGTDTELGFRPTPRGSNATTGPVATPSVREAQQTTLLKELLRQQRSQTYSAFCRLYKKAAAEIDKSLVHTYPAERQYYRWINGGLSGLPYPDHCNVLEVMFPDYSAEQLFEVYHTGEAPTLDDSNNKGSSSLAVPTTSTGRVSAAESKEEDVNRLEFIGGLLATIAAPGSLFSESARIGANDIARCRQNLEQLYSLDDHYGASAEVYSLTVRSLRKILRDLEGKSYTPAIGQGVRTVAGELMEHAGWLAFDAGQNAHARYWWLEALHTARMADCEAVEVVVLASMSLAASMQGRGREAVDLANAAQRAAKSHQTPRLLSVLSAREALGHAYSGDERAATKALGTARSYLDRSDRHDDDPSWLDFWGPSDFFGHEAQAQRNLNNLTSAERSVREALASVDADSHPRNHALYLSRLAVILAASKKYDEAVPITAKAVLWVNDVNSNRLTSEVKTALADISAMGDAPKSRELVEWASPMLSRTAPWPREV